jgi:hypothetical protein
LSYCQNWTLFFYLSCKNEDLKRLRTIKKLFITSIIVTRKRANSPKSEDIVPTCRSVLKKMYSPMLNVTLRVIALSFNENLCILLFFSCFPFFFFLAVLRLELRALGWLGSTLPLQLCLQIFFALVTFLDGVLCFTSVQPHAMILYLCLPHSWDYKQVPLSPAIFRFFNYKLFSILKSTELTFKYNINPI